MRATLRFLLSIFAFSLVAAPARAQRIDSPYRFIDTKQEAGAYVGYVSTSKGSSRLGHESGTAYGVRYGIRFSGPFSIDVDAMYFPSKYAVLDTTVTDSAYTQIGTATSNLAVATAAFRLNLTGSRTWNNLLPYVAFGVGGAIETSKDKDEIEKAPLDARYTFGTSFAGTFGAGIELFPTDRLAIRVDGRNVLWKIKAPAALLRGRLGALTQESEWVNNFTVSAGVALHF